MENIKQILKEFDWSIPKFHVIMAIKARDKAMRVLLHVLLYEINGKGQKKSKFLDKTDDFSCWTSRSVYVSVNVIQM